MEMHAPHASADAAPTLFARAVATAPDAIALRAACGTLTYAELDARAARLAGWLASLGVTTEGVVGICLDRSFDQITLALATWKAGGAYLPLDPAWPDARLRIIVDDARCTVVVGRTDIAERLRGAAAPLVSLDWNSPTLASALPVACDVAPDALAYVIYTSGTTGTPKGVEITHANLAHLIAWHNEAFAVTAADRATHLAGLGFDAAVWEAWPYLCAGASVLLASEAVRTSAPALQAWLIEERATIAFAPTALAEQLIASDWPADTRLRVLLTGADRLTARPPADLPFCFVNNYGPTECTVVATSATVTAGGDGLPAIGHPIGATTIQLLDPTGKPVPPGMVGELYIGGPSVARGYRGQPALTAERFPIFDGARTYRTGDLAGLLPDGQLAFHGRVDTQVKIRGHRVEPNEVAQVLRGHSAITACAVVAREGHDDTVLVAYCVTDAPLTAKTAREYLVALLPDYMVPSAFVRLDALPFTANGKLDKAALPAPSDANALPSAAFTAPQTEAEERLAEILAAVLGREQVSVDDNFFLLGGHSLLGTQVVLRAGEAFGVELTLLDLFQAPTIRQLAARVEDRLYAMLAAMTDDEADARAAA